MPEPTFKVTTKARNTTTFPEYLNAGVVSLRWLFNTERLKEIQDKIRVYRQGGYCASDVIAFLIAFFSAKSRSLHEFAYQIQPWKKQLAAQIGLKSLPHQSSVSRLCACIEDGSLRCHWSWLLFDMCDGPSVLMHPSTGHYNAKGDRWDVFDFDPSVIAIRQRGLPTATDTPEGRRRSYQTKPGYGGRHRGETVMSRMFLRHSGSGMWLGVEVHGGNGDIRGAFERAAAAVASLCDRSDINKTRVIMRCDGAHGHVPHFDACKKAGISVVTRLSHYGLFEREDIQRHLKYATWKAVTDSTSGPCREATDLGEVTLQPDKKTVRKDGSNFDPITVRVVATRAYTRNDAGAGVLIDGKLYELYGTDLGPENWPAEDVAALYHQRADIENSINQVHDLCDVNKVFSNHLPGQEFITAVGLMVYNLQIALGVKFTKMPDAVQAQAEREKPSHIEPTAKTDAAASSTVDSDSNAEKDFRVHESEMKLGRILNLIDWDPVCERLGPGWNRHENWPYICCPKGCFLMPNRPGYHEGQKNPRLFFKIPADKCAECSSGSSCAVGSSSNRRVTTTTSPKRAKRIDAAVMELRRSKEKTSRTDTTQDSNEPTNSKSKRRRHKKGRGFSWRPPQPSSVYPLFETQIPLFLPAEARKVAREHFRQLELQVQVFYKSSSDPQHCKLVASTSAQKQRRRKTWAERLKYNALPDDTLVEIQIFSDNEESPCVKLCREPNRRIKANAA